MPIRPPRLLHPPCTGPSAADCIRVQNRCPCHLLSIIACRSSSCYLVFATVANIYSVSLRLDCHILKTATQTAFYRHEL
ncbi:hypothetical protein Bpfe_003046 [Biomphalaria pfeifferi]|uniref:Uncharacterized protein n=1 Tax=Biomphalaria pfeifferi TaxID=112525 RepID=A0AAD8C8I8_BIOPF|nr:hypothetical protein Bpfe_003046 [Biomphalaria pfeifferi]